MLEHRVLDAQTGLVYEPGNLPLSNPHALFYLRDGLHWLATAVRQRELQIIREQGATIAMMPGSEIPDMGLLSCASGWFCLSLTNYLRIIALCQLLVDSGVGIEQIPGGRKQVSKHCKDFVSDIVPEVQRWRNKVSAHPAITDPRSKDNVATLAASVMWPISYKRPYLKVRALILGHHSGDMSQLPEWSVTQVFEELAPRFWPELTLDELPKIAEDDMGARLAREKRPRYLGSNPIVLDEGDELIMVVDHDSL